MVGVPSVGASGAIFGTVAVGGILLHFFRQSLKGSAKVTWVDLFAHWRYHYRPVTKVGFLREHTYKLLKSTHQLIYMTIELIIGIGMGFIPYVDNFGTCLIMDSIHSNSYFKIVSASGGLPDGTSRRNRLLPCHKHNEKA